MNRIATINVSLKGKSFTSKFPIDDNVQEYQIADEAYRLGLLFAETQILSLYGHRISSYEFASFISDLNYTYNIKEDK